MSAYNALRHRARFTLERLLEIRRNAHRGSVPDSAPLVISIHVPKTAGTSFRRFLGSAYGRRLLYDYGPANPMTTPLIARSVYHDDVAERGAELRLASQENRVKCIHGHFAASGYHALLPDARYAFWLREPVERLISLYYAHQKQLKPGQEAYGSMDLLEYAQQPEMRNVQSAMVEGIPEESILFVGISERFNESLERFATAVGASPPAARLLLNANPAKPAIGDPAVREEIAALNASDVELYRKALARLDAME